MKICDELYEKRLEEWQDLIDLYDLKFKKQIRDLDMDDLVKVSRFYPLVRQIVASIAYNYPKMFFEVHDDDSDGVADLLERASDSLLKLMKVKPHVHQAIFDALFCSVGWLRVDFNPPGDDLIPPYVANDAMHEDLTAINRVPPGFVHVDPQCPPHALGHARYIRERMWVPLKQLKADPLVQHKGKLKATSPSRKAEIGFGEPEMEDADSPEMKARQDSIENGEFVIVDRIHDRMNRKMYMFVEDIDDPILEIEHPFMKMSYEAILDPAGNIMFEDDGVTPLLNLESAEPAPGWLVEDGFPFIPVKFDLHSNSFYPHRS